VAQAPQSRGKSTSAQIASGRRMGERESYDALDPLQWMRGGRRDA